MAKSGLWVSLACVLVIAASVTLNVCLFKELRKKDSQTPKSTCVAVRNKKDEKKEIKISPAAGSKTKKAVVQDLILKSAYYNSWDECIELDFSGNFAIVLPQNQNWLTLEPAVNVTVRQLSVGKLRLKGNFTAEKYKIKIAKGLENKEGAKLAFNAEADVVITPKEPTFNFLSDGMIFPVQRAKPMLPMEVCNVKELHVALYSFYDNNLWLGSSSEQNFRTARKINQKVYKLDLKRNKKYYYPINLDQLMEKWEPGLYGISVRKAADDYEYSDYYTKTRFFAVTDLAIQAVIDEKGKKVFAAVNSLQTTKPVAGTSVSLYSQKNQLLAKGTTDARGIVNLDYSRSVAGKDSGDAPKLLIAKHGKDVSFFYCSYNGYHSLSVFDDNGHIYSISPRAFVFTERGVYRPGEKVHVSAWIRNKDFSVYKNTPCSLILEDSRGNVLFTRKMKTSAQGLAVVDFKLPADIPSGNFYFICKTDDKDQNQLGRTSFVVADFVADRIKVQITPSVVEVKADQNVEFKIAADYYFGKKVDNGYWKFTVESAFSPKQPAWKGWTVGTKDSFKHAYYSDSGNIKDGVANVKYPGFKQRGGRSSAPVTLSVSAQVSEPGGRAVTGKSTVIYHPFDWYFGCRKNERAALPGEVVFDWKLFPAVKDMKIPAAKRDFKVVLLKKDWDYVLKKSGSSYRHVWVENSTEVKNPGSFSSNAAEGVWKMKLDSGSYDLQITVDGRTARTSFYHYYGEGGVRSANPSLLSFKTDKTEYRSGDTAAVTFVSPVSGSAFVTVGDYTLRESYRFAVKAGENTLQIPLGILKDTSSVYIGVTVAGLKHRLFGLLCLAVKQDQRALNVKLTVPAKARPLEKIKIEAQLLSPDGVPQNGVVQLFAVDEGILALTAYKTPDIFDYFFGKYACGFNYGDIYSMIYPELTIDDKNGKIGGDAVAASKLGKLYKSPLKREKDKYRAALPEAAVIVLPPITVKNGKATAEMKLPDHLGALRIMAVASTLTRVGSAAEMLIMRDQIGIMPSAPVQVVPGDESTVTCTLFNYELPVADALFTFRGPDGKKETFKLTIPKGKSVVKKIVCKFPEKVGFVELDAELKIGNVVKHNRISVMVRPPYPLTSQSIFKMLKPGERWNLSGENLPVFIGKTDYTVSFSASPGLALKDALSWLNDYPYGCLEQTVSAAFPLFSVDTLLKFGLISQEMADTAKAKLTPAAAKLRSMQLADGSFAAWPGSMEHWVDASVFALHFLSECNSYPQDRFTQNFLRGLAEDTGKSRFSRAYACYVLALRKDDAFLQNARNLIKSPKDDFATFLAACALIEGHYAGEAFPILKRVLEKEVWRNPAELPYYCNNVSCMGMALRLLMKYDHESPAVGKLVAELQKKLRNDGSGWGTTQSNAWAVLGLSSFVREFGAAAGNVAIDIGKGKMLALSLTRPQKQVLDAAQLKKCVVKNTGKSAVYVQLNVSGYPKTLEDHSRVMKISRKITNASGKKVSSAKQGDLLTVVWEIESSAAVEDVVIADLLPGGLEIEDDRLASRMNMQKDKKTKGQQIRIKHLEKQTGLFLVFGNISAGKTTFRYQARAVSSGVYSPGAIRAEAMYEPDNTAVSSVKDKFVVK